MSRRELPPHPDPEKGKQLDSQLQQFIVSFCAKVSFNRERAQEYYPKTRNPDSGLLILANPRANRIMHRNNETAELFKNPLYKESSERQRNLSGPCVARINICIDGRVKPIYVASHAAEVNESLAAVITTEKSKFDGGLILQSATLTSEVARRPQEQNSELLEIFLPHFGSQQGGSNCKAMELFRDLYAKRGTPFETDDLMFENRKLFIPAIETITLQYNKIAEKIGKPKLTKAAIGAFYDTDTMGILLGYGDRDPLFSTELVKQFEDDLGSRLATLYGLNYRYPGYCNDTFTKREEFIEKEEMLTNIIEALFSYPPFTEVMTNANTTISELQGLTDNQLKAVKFKIARFIGLQYLTYSYESTHPFKSHNEQYIAVTVRDGLDVKAGDNDPEAQVFGATTANAKEAVDHIRTGISLMESSHCDTSRPNRPHLVFISSGLADGINSLDQSRGTLLQSFRDIVYDDDIFDLITAGLILPIPLIMNKYQEIVEIPNLALQI